MVLCRRKTGTRLARGQCQHRAWNTGPRRSSCSPSSPFNVPAPRARHGRMSSQRKQQYGSGSLKPGLAQQKAGGPSANQGPRHGSGLVSLGAAKVAAHWFLVLRVCWTAFYAAAACCWLPAGLISAPHRLSR